jgi:diaminopimelate epimerase
MVYYNADGNESTMCGNGGRCIVAFAKKLGIIQEKTVFLAIDGVHNAFLDQTNLVNLQMSQVDSVIAKPDAYFLNTGSPHYITWVADSQNFLVKENGAKIRYNAAYAPNGVNVNFVQVIDHKNIKVRTYERGVEDETLSCGTGVTAAAIAFHFSGKTTENVINIETLGGLLQVRFDFQNQKYNPIFLIGPAEFVFQGTFDLS